MEERVAADGGRGIEDGSLSTQSEYMRGKSQATCALDVCCKHLQHYSWSVCAVKGVRPFVSVCVCVCESVYKLE